MRKRLIAPTFAVLVAATALGPAPAEAQGSGRATGTARSSGIGIADRIGAGGIADRIGDRSITGSAWGITRNWRPGGPIGSRFRSGSAGRSIGVANSPFGTIQHCAGVSVVTASSIWGASIRDCGHRTRSKHTTTALLPVVYPIYLPIPYVYAAPYVDLAAYPPGVPGFVTPAEPVAARPATGGARTYAFDPTRPAALIWPPGLFALPVPVYTLGNAVIYVEHTGPSRPAQPVVQPPGAPPISAPAASACARLTVILSTGDGWWKTVWLPALGAGSIDGLRAAIDARLADAPITITDATGIRFEIPPRAGVRSVMVDPCPPRDGGR